MLKSVKKLLINFILMFLTFGFCIVLFEIIMNVVSPESSGYFTLIPKTTITMLPDSSIFPGIHGASVFKTNKYGIRGREITAMDTLKILTVGGSTTECLYLDQSETWQTLLENKMNENIFQKKVWVGNIGKSGLTSFDNFIQLKFSFSNLPKIDVLMVMVGINDMLAFIAKDKKNAFIHDNEIIRDSIVPKVFARYPKSGALSIIKNSRLYRLVRNVYVQIKFNDVIQNDSGKVYNKWRANKKKSKRIIDHPPDLRVGLDEYEKNIDSIITIMTNRVKKIIFLSQASIWRSDLTKYEINLLWMGGKGDYQKTPGQEYYSVNVLGHCIELFNNKLKEICLRRNVELIDICQNIPKDTSAFYDDVHFNENGARILANLLFSQIKNIHYSK